MALVFGPVALLGSSRVAIVVARQVHRFRANADAASAPAPARWRRSSCRGVSACALGRKTPDRSRRFRPPLRRTRTCSRGYFLSGGRDDSGAEDAGGRCQGRLEGPPRRGVRPPRCLPAQPTLRARHGLATGRRSAPVQTVNATAGRGRDSPSPCGLGLPPAQIPACASNALGSCLGFWRQSGRRAKDAGCGVWVAIARQDAPCAPRSGRFAGYAAEAPAARAA
jgi:hypothetical protein